MRKAPFTVEDYMRLPDEVRAEVHEGVLVTLPAPDPYHQAVVPALYDGLSAHLGQGEKHRVLVSPVDVFIDDETVLQPDLLVLPEGTRISRRPWKIPLPIWVAEVLSPGTKQRDRGTKLGIYRRAGVREAGVRDPDEETVEMHDLPAGSSARHWGDEVAASRVLSGFAAPTAALFPQPA